MPYIPETDRYGFVSSDFSEQFCRQEIGIMVGQAIRNGGDLQYMLAVAINEYLKKTGLRYQYCQDILGALDGASKEFYRIVIAPYEDSKIAENGGVYTVQGKNDAY